MPAWRAIALLALALLIACAQAGARAATPSIAFAATWDTAAAEVARAMLGPGDLLSHRLANDRAGVFSLPPSLPLVAREAQRPCPASPLTDVVIYDPEHWESTPAQERADLPRSVAQGASAVGSSGCRLFGLAPDGQLMGLPPRACAAVPSPLAGTVDWRRVSVVVVQAQRMLSVDCGGPSNVERYAQFVAEWSRLLKAANPAIRVYASLTFRYTSPAVMQQAVARTRSHVDGYYLAYPDPGRGAPCRYCNAQNLKTVIEAIRQP